MPVEQELNNCDSFPRISGYGNYSGHTLKIDINGTEIWYSYNAIVAFRLYSEGKIYVCENIWGRTTGKYLNWIDKGRKENRYERESFELLIKEKLLPLFAIRK